MTCFLSCSFFSLRRDDRQKPENMRVLVTQADTDNVGQRGARCAREWGLARVPTGNGKQEAVTRA
jgi:hypothetical protein